MNSLFSAFGSMTLLFAPGGAAPEGGAGGGSALMTFAPFVAIIAIFYFLILRPQNKKQKETQRMLSALKKGDRVVTIGGIHGIIQSVKDSTIILKVDENVKLEFNRGAIASVSALAKEDKEEKNDKKLDAPEEKGGDTSETEEKQA